MSLPVRVSAVDGVRASVTDGGDDAAQMGVMTPRTLHYAGNFFSGRKPTFEAIRDGWTMAHSMPHSTPHSTTTTRPPDQHTDMYIHHGAGEWHGVPNHPGPLGSVREWWLWKKNDDGSFDAMPMEGWYNFSYSTPLNNTAKNLDQDVGHHDHENSDDNPSETSQHSTDQQDDHEDDHEDDDVDVEDLESLPTCDLDVQEALGVAPKLSRQASDFQSLILRCNNPSTSPPHRLSAPTPRGAAPTPAAPTPRSAAPTPRPSARSAAQSAPTPRLDIEPARKKARTACDNSDNTTAWKRAIEDAMRRSGGERGIVAKKTLFVELTAVLGGDTLKNAKFIECFKSIATSHSEPGFFCLIESTAVGS